MSKCTQLDQADEQEWADRCQYWAEHRPVRRGRKKKFNYREPLILAGHGIRINAHRNTLLIRPGITHYPQKTEEIRFFPGDANLPDRLITLDSSGVITFDALSWMSDQKIALVQLDWRGRVNFCGNGGFSADPKLVRWQSTIQGSENARQINIRLISAKFDASISTIKSLFGGSKPAAVAIKRIAELKSKISVSKLSSPTILGIEGAASAMYYRLWHDLPLNWSALGKKPIPPDWSKVGARQMIWQRGGSNARHPVNAMLNYGYALLISEVHTAVVASGFDPSIGIAHKRHKNPIPLVYDLIEPMRPIVDRKVLEFALANTFTPGDFTITQKGGCRLNPQLAKSVAKHVAGIRCRSVVETLVNQLA